MGKLDHLKIKRCPAAFAGWARQFNQQVDLLASIQGGPGIDIQVAHSPRKLIAPKNNLPMPKEQPRGKILLTLRPSAISGIGVGGSSGGVGTSNVVTENGTLVGVTRTSNSTGAFPTHLQTGDGSLGSFVADYSTGSFGFIGNGATFSVSAVDLIQNMGLREFTGCNSGSPGNYLTFASDFY